MTAPRQNAGPPQSHIVELQSLRGAAAMIVVLGHCISYYRSPAWYGVIKALVNTQACVEIFFVLSGFVLAKSIARRGFDGPALGAYYIRRGFRIYPALWAASLLALLYVATLQYRVPGPYDSAWLMDRFRADRFTLLHVTASFAGALAYLIPPVWTVFVELLGSLALPAFVYLAQRARRAFFFALAASLALGLLVGGRAYYHLDLYLFEFVLGVAIALPAPRLIAWVQARKGLVGAAALIAAVLLLGTRAVLRPPTFDPMMNVYEALLCAVIVFALGRAGLRVAWLRATPARWVGDISFSIYLLHFSLMCILGKTLYLLSPDLPARIGPIAAGWLLFALTTLVTLPLAQLSYRWVERGGIALGDRLIGRLGLRSRALAAA